MIVWSVPLPSWIAPGHEQILEKRRPSSLMSPKKPSPISHVINASHRPVVGKALNWQGQPQAQLQFATSSPAIRHLVLVAAPISFSFRHHRFSAQSTLKKRRSFRFISLNGKRVRDERGLFAFVHRECANGGTGTGIATRVENFTFEQLTQSRLHETPRAHVLRFFLTPDEPGLFWKWLQHGAQFFLGQGVKLLDPNDRDIVDLVRVAMR